MAPVVRALRDRRSLDALVVVTGQHREQLDVITSLFGIVPDADLNIMLPRQTLSDVLLRIVPSVSTVIRTSKPDLVVIHGDTLSAFGVALSAFFERIPVAHVEAGLRTGRLNEPFPEEAVRRLIDSITTLDLAPTQLARSNLIAEGKNSERIVVTGQTGVDAVQSVAAEAVLREEFVGRRIVCITLHRRENWAHLREIAGALAAVAREFSDHLFVYPVHLNPVVREAVSPELADMENFRLIEPLGYLDMIALMRSSELLVTDSGGLQEEAVTLGVPVVVVRNVTERPEGIDGGAMVLAGTRAQTIASVVRCILRDDARRRQMTTPRNPYGDGRAAKRVVEAIEWQLGIGPRPADWTP